jgi:hypothetical protein
MRRAVGISPHCRRLGFAFIKLVAAAAQIAPVKQLSNSIDRSANGRNSVRRACQPRGLLGAGLGRSR